MNTPAYLRPQSADEVAHALRVHPDAQLLAGGQSLLAAWRLGLCQPSHFVDLQDVPGMQDIRSEGQALWLGAMCTHARIAQSEWVRSQTLMLSTLAEGIADAQIRNVGTLGGSLANNDPAACWPTAVLALNAEIVTNLRSIAADDFFQGLFTTALAPGEWILGVRFPKVAFAAYRKFEQKASRFALVGVAVARSTNGSVRVAITGLGHGVTRWAAAEAALTAHWGVSSLDAITLEATHAFSDIHATALYRAHLARVLCRRVVACDTGESDNLPWHAHNLTPTVHQEARLQGSHMLQATPIDVWQHLLDPTVLQSCIPGCESMTQVEPNHYLAIVKIGLGPISAKFKTQVALFPDTRHASQVPRSCRLVISGQAGDLGEGKATVHVQLHASQDSAHASPCTRIDWQATPEISGKLAQLGNRLVDATAHSLSQQFFNRFSARLSGQPPVSRPLFFFDAWRQRAKSWFQRFFER